MAAIRANVMASIGFVTFPVDVQSATKDPDDSRSSGITMTCDHSVDEKGKTTPHESAGVVQFYECRTCQRKGGREDFGRSFSSATGFAAIDMDAMKALEADESTTKAMSFLAHPTADFDQLTPSGKVYNLACKPGDKNYAAIAEALHQAGGELAFGTVWAARSKNGLYRLLQDHGRLRIQQYAWPSDVNARPEAPELTTERAEQIPALIGLLRGSITPLDVDTYVNDRKAKIEELRFQALGDAPAGKKVEKETVVKTSDNFAESLALAIKEAKATKPEIAQTEGKTGKKAAPRKAAPKKKVPVKQ